jgi:hypothetical protein
MTAPQTLLNSKRCPLCGEVAVEKINDDISFKRRASHHCTAYGAKLTTAGTLQMLWTIPGAALSMGAAFFFVTWIKQNEVVTGAGFAALLGGTFGLAIAISNWFVWPGIVFRPWQP